MFFKNILEIMTNVRNWFFPCICLFKTSEPVSCLTVCVTYTFFYIFNLGKMRFPLLCVQAAFCEVPVWLNIYIQDGASVVRLEKMYFVNIKSILPGMWVEWCSSDFSCAAGSAGTEAFFCGASSVLFCVTHIAVNCKILWVLVAYRWEWR